MKKKIEKTVEYVEDHIKELLKNPKFKKYYEKELANLEKTKEKLLNGDYFQWGKFAKIFSLFNGVEWAKDFASIFNLRKLIIYAIILVSIFGYGYFKGRSNQPLKINLGEYKDAYIKLHDNNLLHIRKDGTVCIQDKDGRILKELKAKDLDKLSKQLAPIGFQLKPIGILGGGVSSFGDMDGEAGIGLRWFKAWKLRADSYLTNKGLYPLGVSYKLDGIGLKNSAIGIGVGTSWNRFMQDKRVMAYFSIEF